MTLKTRIAELSKRIKHAFGVAIAWAILVSALGIFSRATVELFMIGWTAL